MDNNLDLQSPPDPVKETSQPIEEINLISSLKSKRKIDENKQKLSPPTTGKSKVDAQLNSIKSEQISTKSKLSLSSRDERARSAPKTSGSFQSGGGSMSKEDQQIISKRRSRLSEHKSLFQQRKNEHHSFIEAKKSHAYFSAENPPGQKRGLSFSRQGKSFSWISDDEEDEEEEIDTMDDVLWQRDHTFDKLQEIYHHTITGLDISETQGVNLEPVKSLFLNLWNGITQSHQNAARLQKKDHDVSVELAAVMAKTRTLIKLAEEDPEVASRLRTKLESAWGLADIGETEERKNGIKIYELKEEIFMLNRSINAAAKTEGQSTVVELTRLKTQFESQRNNFATEATKLNSDLKIIFEKRNELGELKSNLEEKLKKLTEEEAINQEGISREKLRKERLQKAIKQTIAKTEQKTLELEQLVTNLHNAQHRLAEVERFVREQRLVNEDAMHELEISSNKYAKIKQDYESQVKVCERLTTELFKRQIDLKDREDEVAVARSLISRMNRQKQANLKKVVEYKVIVSGLEAAREVLKTKLAVLEKDLEAAQKKLEENKRYVEELDRERGIMNRTLQRAVVIANTHDNQVLTHEVAVRNLMTDISGYEREIGLQGKVISHLEKERDNYSHEAMKLAHQLVIRLEEARKMDRNIYEYHKKLGRIETQLKKQQQIYETALYEKTVAQRQLRDALNEGMENSLKLMYLGHEILGLKFQVGEKDTIIHIEASRYERVLRETTFYAGEGKRLKHMAYDMQRMVEALGAERYVLKKTVAAVESEMSKQLYYTITAESRKNVFSRKLMTKEQELKEIWENWRVLHSKIRIGNYHFRNLIADIRRIRVLIFETKKENLVKSHGKQRARKLQHEISVLENIISKETCMCNSLRESMRHPINVHRWRVLECTNPEAFDMVLKVNLLNKRLVDRNAVVAQQEQDLSYKQEIYCEIREALKAPGMETPENVTYYRHLVAAKKRQYQTLKFELEASTSHAEYYEEEGQLIKDRFKKLKNLYFQRMKKLGRQFSCEYDSDLELGDYQKHHVGHVDQVQTSTFSPLHSNPSSFVSLMPSDSRILTSKSESENNGEPVDDIRI